MTTIIMQKVRLKNCPTLWKATLLGQPHIGGMGSEPAEALGFLIINHPAINGPFAFEYRNRPPKNYDITGKLPIHVSESEFCGCGKFTKEKESEAGRPRPNR